MSSCSRLHIAAAMRTLSLPETSAEEFEQKDYPLRLLHLVAPMTKGQSKLVVNGRLIHDGVLGPGMLRVCNPADDEQRLVTRPLKVMVFTLPAERFNKLCADRGCPSAPPDGCISESRPICNKLVSQLTATALMADELALAAREIFINGITEALVSLIVDARQKSKGRTTPDAERKLSSRQLGEAIAFADSHLGDKLSVADWAEVTNLSASEFGRRFQASTQLTPYAWYIQRRIERAQELLQQRSTIISELALTLGFTSQSHFTEAFRRRIGISPARWRSLHRDFDSVAVS